MIKHSTHLDHNDNYDQTFNSPWSLYQNAAVPSAMIVCKQYADGADGAAVFLLLMDWVSFWIKFMLPSTQNIYIYIDIGNHILRENTYIFSVKTVVRSLCWLCIIYTVSIKYVELNWKLEIKLNCTFCHWVILPPGLKQNCYWRKKEQHCLLFNPTLYHPILHHSSTWRIELSSSEHSSVLTSYKLMDQVLFIV